MIEIVRCRPLNQRSERTKPHSPLPIVRTDVPLDQSVSSTLRGILKVEAEENPGNNQRGPNDGDDRDFKPVLDVQPERRIAG